MHWSTPLRLVVMLGCLLALTAPTFAQPLADHVPGDALVYVGWRGTEATEGQYADSNLEAVLARTRLRTLLVEVLPRVLEQQGDAMGPNTDRARAAVSDVLAPVMCARPWALYGRLVMSDQGPPQPEVALLIDAGERAADVESAARQLIELAQGEAPQQAPPVNVQRGEGMVTVRMFGAPAAPDTLDANARFDEARRRLPEPAAGLGVLYLDLNRLLKLATGMPQTGLDPRMVQALGLDGLEQLIASTGFDGERWRTDLFIHAPGARRGLLSLMEGAPFDAEMLRLVPRGAVWFNAARLDMAALLDAIREAAQGMDPGTADQLEQTLMMLSMQTGVDIEAELIDNLGPVWLTYNNPAATGFNSMGAVVINPLREAATVETALTHLTQMINDMLLQQQAGGPLRWRMVSTEHAGMTIHTAVLPLISPSWAVHEDRLYVGLLPQALMVAAEGSEASILENPTFQQLRGRLNPGERFTSLSYLDLQALAPMTYQSYLMLTQTLPAAAIAFGAEGPVTLLPPLRNLMPYIGPAGGTSWSDDAGWHARWNSPFPGSTALGQPALGGMLSNPASIQSSAMMIGTMLPALNAARGTARQMESNTQARGIHQAQVIFAQTNEKDAQGQRKYSNDIAELYEDHLFTADYAIAPMADVTVPHDFDQWSEQQQNQWLRENASYVLVPDLVEDLDSEKIALFLRPDHSNGEGISVAYNDNYVVWETDIDAVRRKLREQTGMTMEELIERQRNHGH